MENDIVFSQTFDCIANNLSEKLYDYSKMLAIEYSDYISNSLENSAYNLMQINGKLYKVRITEILPNISIKL